MDRLYLGYHWNVTILWVDYIEGIRKIKERKYPSNNLYKHKNNKLYKVNAFYVKKKKIWQSKENIIIAI